MKLRISSTVLIIALVSAALAQEQKPNLQAFVDTSEDRGETRVLYWDGAKNAAAGQVIIHYGRPAWRPEYDEAKNFDAMTKGKIWRLGKNFWTTLSTDLPLKIAGREIAPGAYHLGAERSSDGATWSLVFYDPTQVRASHVDASQIEKASPAFKAPLTFQTTATTNERLSITLTNSKEKLQEIALKIVWGKFELTAPVLVQM